MHATAQRPTDQQIYARIYDAILARRLQPGARLGEEELARLFDVSRTKIRAAIVKLAQDGVVQTRRNHGASVTAPTRDQARHVMEFRRMLEPPVAASLARTRPAALAGLRPHIEAEHAARAAQDDPALIRLTGEFHLRLAELHGNDLIIRSLREAEALTCLSILSYGRPSASACLPDEHARILAAIEAGSAETAAGQMLQHLDHVADGMDLIDPEIIDLAKALDVTRNAA